jgi:flagellum-specific ATP synthase
MDSLTRYAMAQREIALAIGRAAGDPRLSAVGIREAAAARRARRQRRARRGLDHTPSTVLTEGDDPHDRSRTARATRRPHRAVAPARGPGTLPGHRHRGLDQPRDDSLVDAPHFELTRRFRALYSRYQRNRDLVSVGAYAAGSDPLMDEALALHPRMEAFLQQNMKERARWADCAAALHALISPGAVK